MPNFETPVFDFGDPTWMTVVAVEQTPAELIQYNGRIISIADPADIPTLGVRGIARVSGVEVPGYCRNVNGGYEWVMLARQDPLDAFVATLPGPSGWSVAASQTTWLQIAYALRGAGISLPDLGYGLPQLFSAAKAEVLGATTSSGASGVLKK